MIQDGLAAIAVHEMAHIAAAGMLRVRVKAVGLTWKGPYVRRELGTNPQNLAITLAGPGANLLLAIACWHSNPVFALNNAILGLFNLIPIPFSDGRRALDLLQGAARRPVPASTKAFELGRP
jgi:Zn-dependent protease